ncbi:MAG: HAD-IA family hydrolase [Steroidobacteraceae bacterium]|jgi:putative hydrolase of the HAD superfamily
MSFASSKALILDFGGVISRTLFETHDLSEAALGLPPGTLTWKGPFDPENDPLWQAMQANEISERDYWMTRTREVGHLLGEDWQEMQTLVQRTRGADVEAVIRPEASVAISQAKSAGCKLAILSNELDLFYGSDFRLRLPLLAEFEVIVDATYTGVLKPDPRAYEECLVKLEVEASRAVFVDDQLRNVEGARRSGLEVVHFDVRDPISSYNKAMQLLGLNSINRW